MHSGSYSCWFPRWVHRLIYLNNTFQTGQRGHRGRAGWECMCVCVCWRVNDSPLLPFVCSKNPISVWETKRLCTQDVCALGWRCRQHEDGIEHVLSASYGEERRHKKAVEEREKKKKESRERPLSKIEAEKCGTWPPVCKHEGRRLKSLPCVPAAPRGLPAFIQTLLRVHTWHVT